MRKILVVRNNETKTAVRVKNARDIFRAAAYNLYYLGFVAFVIRLEGLFCKHDIVLICAVAGVRRNEHIGRTVGRR